MDLRSRALSMDAVEEAAEGGEPEATLLATGPEVAGAPEAREALTQKGVDARVVSMPSWEGCVGFKGASIGINRFGAPAPVGVGA